MIIIYILVYLVGCVCAYRAARKDYRHTFNRWTKGDRAVALGISMFSWLAWLATAATANGDRPASW